MASKSRSKRLKRIARIVAAIWIVLIAVMVILGAAKAEREPSEVWVLCQPDSFVFVRMFPNKKSEEIGRLELGDMAWTDGKKKNGFLHIIDMHFECDGWISTGFISRTPVQRANKAARIVSRGRVRARRCINGSRRKWLKNAQEMTVYGYGQEWAVTSEGFIQTKFLEWEEKNSV